MSTLVAVGTSAAWLQRMIVTLWPQLAARWGFPFYLYYEVAVIVIALILLGRWLRPRAKKQTGAAIKALSGSPGQDRPRVPQWHRAGRRMSWCCSAILSGVPEAKSAGRWRGDRGSLGARREAC